MSIMLISIQNQRQPDIFQMKYSSPLLVITILCVTFEGHSLWQMQNACQNPQVHRYLDISDAYIEKSKNLQFSLTLLETPIQVNHSNHGIVLKGNFSRLVLKNVQSKIETIYDGTQMVIKIPPNHVFNLQKIPEVEIQINHIGRDLDEKNPIRFIMLSQLYVLTKFTNKIETILSKHIHSNLRNGEILQTSRLVKIIDGFPMLMYRGSQESYPCRSDLLCFVKRQYQLIGESDFEQLKKIINFQTDTKTPKKAYRRKNLYEIYPIKSRPMRKIGSDDEL